MVALRDATAGIGREQEAYGVLRVTTLPDVAALVVAPLLPGFLARYPRVRLEIEATVRLVDLVSEGFDLGIRRRGLPKHPEDLIKHEVVLFNGWTSVTLQGAKGLVKVPIQGRSSVNDLFVTREAIVAGLGIGALASFVAAPELATGRIVRALPEHRVAGGATYLVHPPAKPLSAKLVAFCSYLLEHAPRLIGPPS